MEINLEKLFTLADNSNMCNIRVEYSNGYKEYKLCDGTGTVVLNGDLEEKIFLLFKYPEVYVDEIADYLHSNESLLNQYFSNPNSVRELLRRKFKDLLMEKAKEMVSKSERSVSINSGEQSDHSVTVVVKQSVEPKPIYKSKTVVFNTTVLATSLALILKGIADHDYHEISEGLVPLIIAIVNFILRLVTKKPIKL